MLIRTTTIAGLLLVVILLPLFAVNPERGYKAKPDKYGIEFRESGIKRPMQHLLTHGRLNRKTQQKSVQP
ncbi:MAG: hypothetical protein JNN25_10180 [Candidatus Kapabacteria bacterium]|nr:hypothetical protein [Candidatus Kapabacteria bacterium]